MTKILLKNARVVDVENEVITKPLDIRCANGRIVEMRGSLDKKDASEMCYDLKNLWVCPGLIDIHVDWPINAKDPCVVKNLFQEAKSGGVTGMGTTPHSDPIVDKGFLVDYLIGQGLKYGISIHPLGALSENLKGEKLSEMVIMKKYGVAGFADTGHSTVDTKILRCAMEYAQSMDLPLFLDCEDHYLSEGGVVHEGEHSTKYGLLGIPSQAESIIVARNLELAELTGASIHIQSVSTARSIVLIAEAKKKGIAVTAETSPVYFSLHSGNMEAYNVNFKLRPPLREERDCEALRQAILDDTIDVIVSNYREGEGQEGDHLFQTLPIALHNLEHTLGLSLTEFSDETDVMKAKVLSKMSFHPSKILGLKEKRVIKMGSSSDMIVIDPNRHWEVYVNRNNGQLRRSPFVGKKLTGKVLATFISGVFVYNRLDSVDTDLRIRGEEKDV